VVVFVVVVLVLVLVSFDGSGAGAGFASSLGAGFGGSADGPHPIKEKLAKKDIAINKTTNFFIAFHLLSLLVKHNISIRISKLKFLNGYVFPDRLHIFLRA
jgi:hypothetical protein